MPERIHPVPVPLHIEITAEEVLADLTYPHGARRPAPRPGSKPTLWRRNEPKPSLRRAA